MAYCVVSVLTLAVCLRGWRATRVAWVELVARLYDWRSSVQIFLDMCRLPEYA